MLSGRIDPYWYLIAWQLSKWPSTIAACWLLTCSSGPATWQMEQEVHPAWATAARCGPALLLKLQRPGPMRPFYRDRDMSLYAMWGCTTSALRSLRPTAFVTDPLLYDLESFFSRIWVSRFGILSPVDGVSLMRIALPQGYNHSQPGVTWQCSPIPTPTWALHQRDFGPGGVNWWTLLSFWKISAFGKLKKSQRFTRYQWANQRTVAFPCPRQFIRRQRSWIGSAATCRDTWSLYHQTHSLSVNYNELALAFTMIN